MSYPAFVQNAFLFGDIDFICQHLDQEPYSLVPTAFCCKHRAYVSIKDGEAPASQTLYLGCVALGRGCKPDKM